MNWKDLLRMSSSNLKRRKLRTFLTVLGVVIGTASIVVMISLGLGLQESLYREVEQSGGLTTITVRGAQAGDSMIYYGDGEKEESVKYVNDQMIEKLSELEHIQTVSPVYELPVVLLKGRYEGYAQLVGMTPEGLQSKNIPLKKGGALPRTGTNQLDLVVGNGIPTMFTEKGTGKGF